MAGAVECEQGVAVGTDAVCAVPPSLTGRTARSAGVVEGEHVVVVGTDAVCAVPGLVVGAANEGTGVVDDSVAGIGADADVVSFVDAVGRTGKMFLCIILADAVHE